MRRSIIAGIVLVLLSGMGVYLIARATAPKSDPTTTGDPSVLSGVSPQTIAEIAHYQYTQVYTNPTYHFSFKYPKGFTVSATNGLNNSYVILVEKLPSPVGVQILISSFNSPDLDMTPELIHESVPGLPIENPQVIDVGTPRKGLAFLSNNQEFGGKSREAWFAFEGNLYQISTFAEFAGLLNGVVATLQLK
jgi:hypothetical protein